VAMNDTFGGFTLDELGDYLDDDRTPANPAIDSSPEAAAALDRLAELREASRDLVEREAEDGRAGDTAWIDGVLAVIRTTAHAGRDIPVATAPGVLRPGVDDHLVVTEGALRGVVRRLGDALPGVVVRRTRFIGDVRVHGEPIDVEVVVAVRVDQPIAPRTETLRAGVLAALEEHSPLVVRSVVVRVADVVEGSRA
jgi:hypothetical protein